MSRLQLLKGVRIVDLSHAHAGPLCTQILADMGAEVIKIESPNIGELTRVLYPFVEEGISYYYFALNRNKKSLTLDLQTPSGKNAFYDLVKISDVVIDNFRGGSLKRLGADYETITKINPRIISCSIFGYGPSGPLVELPINDDVATAITGMYSLSGHLGGIPARPPAPVADISSGMYAAMGIMLCLYERTSTGKGRKLEIGLLDSAISLLSTFYQKYFLTGVIPQCQGSKHATLPFVGVFATKDGYIGLGPCWPRIARVVNKENLIDDPRFATAELRTKNKVVLEAEIEEALKEHDTNQWVELLRAEDIPVGRVNNLEEALQEPQIVQNNIVGKLEFDGREFKVIECPIKISGASHEEHLAPARLGEHSVEVFKEILNYSDDQINEILKEQEDNWEELSQRIRGIKEM